MIIFSEEKLARLAQLYQQHRAGWAAENEDKPYDPNWWRKGKGKPNKQKGGGRIKVHRRAGYQTARKAKAQ